MSNQSIKLATMTDKLGQINAAIRQFEEDAKEPKAYLSTYFNEHMSEIIKGQSFKAQFIIANRLNWNKSAIEALALRTKTRLEALQNPVEARYVRVDPLPSAFL